MDANFQACLAVILQSEGGFVVDQGGPTNLGFTIPMLSAWLRRPADEADIRALTPTSVAAPYRYEFWNPSHCPMIPAGLDLMVFDEAVNEGQGRAIRHLQEALGVMDDGMFGANTALALRGLKDIRATIAKLHDDNAAYYASLDAKYPQDERGWTARNDRTRNIAMGMVTA